MADYEAIRKDLYERFHVAFEKLYVSELKDQIADKDEVITAQDHMIAEQDARIAQLEVALRFYAGWPQGPAGNIAPLMIDAGHKARAALENK